LIGSNSEVIDRENLIVHVEACFVRRRSASDLRHDNPAAIDLRDRTERGFSRRLPVIWFGDLESKSERIERVGVIEFGGAFECR
jgi:hypothetical protein